jgi:hypothetical protein
LEAAEVDNGELGNCRRWNAKRNEWRDRKHLWSLVSVLDVQKFAKRCPQYRPNEKSVENIPNNQLCHLQE